MNIESHKVNLNGTSINVEVKIQREGTWCDLGVYYTDRYCDVIAVGKKSVSDYFTDNQSTYFDDMKKIKSQII